MSLGDVDEERHTLTVATEEVGERLDRLLAKHIQELSRSRLKTLVLAGQVTIDGHTVRDPGHRVHAGNEINVAVPLPEPAAPRPEAIPLNIVFEDDAIIVLD